MEIKEILQEEPRLIAIFNEAKKVEGHFWKRNDYWYKRLKPRMIKLVGIGCKNTKLKSTDVYDSVYFLCIKLMRL